MIRTLHHAPLPDGQRLRVAELQAPAASYARAIRRFLQHKGQPWMTHVDLANRGQVDHLRTTYTIGLLGRRIVGNVMIVGDGRVGILGHVFTHPHHRRKGICTELVAAALAQFRAAGGLALGLGTGYRSPAYRIYHGFGFRSVESRSGAMLLPCQPGALDRYFAHAPTQPAELRWHHWAGLSLLFMLPAGDQLRSHALRVVGPAGFEGGFLHFQAHRQRLDARARVLLTPEGSVAGAALCQRNDRWPGAVYTLDLFVHPAFRRAAPALLHALPLPRRAKLQAVIDRPSAARAAALRSQGFRHEATLAKQLRRRGRPVDVLIYGRHT